MRIKEVITKFSSVTGGCAKINKKGVNTIRFENTAFHRGCKFIDSNPSVINCIEFYNCVWYGDTTTGVFLLGLFNIIFTNFIERRTI